jgi:hypothetical protein
VIVSNTSALRPACGPTAMRYVTELDVRAALVATGQPAGAYLAPGGGRAHCTPHSCAQRRASALVLILGRLISHSPRCSHGCRSEDHL